MPIVRTFVSLAAGISSYDRKKFHLWNTVGAIAWIGVIGLAGVLLGGIPFVHNNIEYIAVIIVLVSVVPVLSSTCAAARRLSANPLSNA